MVKHKYNRKMVDIVAHAIAYLIAAAVYPVVKVSDLYHGLKSRNYADSKIKIKQKSKYREGRSHP